MFSLFLPNLLPLHGSNTIYCLCPQNYEFMDFLSFAIAAARNIFVGFLVNRKRYAFFTNSRKTRIVSGKTLKWRKKIEQTLAQNPYASGFWKTITKTYNNRHGAHTNARTLARTFKAAQHTYARNFCVHIYLCVCRDEWKMIETLLAFPWY